MSPIKGPRPPWTPAGVKFEPLGRCPCGGEIAAADDPPAVAHSVPYCLSFEKMEPVEFLAYVRRSRGIPEEEKTK